MRKLLSITKSKSKAKKYDAVFQLDGEGKKKTVGFGQAGADDYTIKKDKDQRSRYRKRHTKDLLTETNKKGLGAGSLSYWLLWGNSTSLKQNIVDYKKRFKL